MRVDGEKEHMVLIQETAGGAADSFHVEKGGAGRVRQPRFSRKARAVSSGGGTLSRRTRVSPPALQAREPSSRMYIELTLRLIQGAGDSEVVSAFDIKMLETLAATTAYDGTIAQACRDIASLSGGGTADNGIEGYADMMAYSAGYFDLLADALTGNGYEAARALAEFCSSRPALELYQATPLIF